MLVAMGPLVTVGTSRTTLGPPPGSIVVLAALGARVGGRNNYLRFQRGDQGPDREGGRAGGDIAPGEQNIVSNPLCFWGILTVLVLLRICLFRLLV